ncbi:MFS transporter, NAG-T family, sugar:H+ symporter [Marchantia polymorpha subsp. ruderalis]|uniref:UNC93-like protein n=2 Tax=Marchantia polymorpha TaxID=3197 RepID=A0AAF6AQ11_MARPO|nr:hypothetical protein MARPO_0179s0003 [Marchantia polymorpha]BBM98531.1 hypothetical protein Mp_1g14220 [Marchantia polymorpha subsp. ruderalis]|eukprot:PTQ27912.1 hypothetical protein MARPO_0179s0003 [Marchantia polymorpha]
MSMERSASSGHVAVDRSPSGIMDRSPSGRLDRSLSARSDASSVCSSVHPLYADDDEAEAQALLRPIIPRTAGVEAWQRQDHAPMLTRSDSMDGSWSPYLRDLHRLSLCFLFVFLAYGATQNLESSLHTDEGLGSTSLGVLYLSLTVCSLGAPIVVMWFGSKNALLLGLSGYWMFIAANLFPSWYTLIPASIFLGFTASVLWVAEGTYLTFAAKNHAAVCNIPEATALGSFNGEFWGVFSVNQVIGNMLSLALLEFRKNPDLQPDKSSAGLVELFLVFLGSMTFGTILACFLRSHAHLTSRASSADVSLANRGYAKASFALLSERKMLFLICLLVYTGMQQAFIWGDFTRDIITPTLGLSWVGGVMAVYGASDTIASFVAGRHSSGLVSISVILIAGACCQILVMGLLFFEGPFEQDSRSYFTVFGAAVIWGVGDATFNTQISAVLGIFYPNDTEAAFAQWKIWQSAATSAAFFVSPYTTLSSKITFLFISLLLSMSLFLVVTWRQSR